MKRKTLTNLQLSKLSQKWHLYPEKLTDKEWELIPLVREWENDYCQFEYEEDEECDDDFILDILIHSLIN